MPTKTCLVNGKIMLDDRKEGIKLKVRWLHEVKRNKIRFNFRMHRSLVYKIHPVPIISMDGATISSENLSNFSRIWIENFKLDHYHGN